MTYSKFDPGCGCCNSFECRTETYPRQQSPLIGWSAFPINEGPGTIDGSPQPLMTGQRMQAPQNVLSRGSEAWYHRIRFTGDIDLEYDGLKIEVRPRSGLINSADQTIPVIPFTDALLAGGFWTDVLIAVTPDWYGVFYYPLHRNTIGGQTTSRGAIQIVDRANDTKDRVITLTARSNDTSITSWIVADMSVRISGDEIERCPRPFLPDGTEQFYTSQRLGSNTFTDPSFPGSSNSSQVPNSFTTSNGPLLIVSAAFGYVDFFWEDSVSGFGNLPDGFDPFYEQKGPFHSGINALASMIIPIGDWPSPLGSRIEFYKRVVWKNVTIEDPYPKPEAFYFLEMRHRQTFALQSNDMQLATYDVSGRAQATLNTLANSAVSWTVA